MTITDEITALFAAERNGVKLPEALREAMVKHLVDSGVDDVTMVHIEDTLFYAESAYDELGKTLAAVIVRRVREWMAFFKIFSCQPK